MRYDERVQLLTFFITILFSLSGTISAQTSQPVYSPRVLLIGIDPMENGMSLAETYFGQIMNGDSAPEFEEELAQQTVQDLLVLSQGRISYEIVEHMRITEFPTYPNGFTFTLENYSQCVWGRPEFDPTKCDEQKFQFQYVEYFEQHHICQKAEDLNVDEIWIISPPYILAWEAFMVGPSPGFNVNGPHYIVPSCDKHIIAVNATYDRPENMLHSYGHRVEATIDYLMRKFTTTDRNNYWERFAARNPSTRQSGAAYCGNVHFPFNFRFEYDFSNSDIKANTCSDFQNFPDYSGQRESYGCQVWGCNDKGWQTHWMSFIPHSPGAVAITNTSGKTYSFMKDWWFYLLYPENALKSEDLSINGDANNDGLVDGKDYVIWLNNYKQSTSAGHTKGDFNTDGIVDGRDYAIWLNNYQS